MYLILHCIFIRGIIQFYIFESYNTAKLQAFLRDKHYKFGSFTITIITHRYQIDDLDFINLNLAMAYI